MIITLFKSVKEAYSFPDLIIDESWEKVKSFLSTHNQIQRKDQIELFNLWEFSADGEPGRKRKFINGEWTGKYETIPGTVRRCKANALQLHGLILDVDEILTIKECIERYKDFEFLLYSTFNNSKEKNKYRVVFPFKEPVPQWKLRIKEESIKSTFEGADNASFSESQAFYLHSGNNPFVHYNQGLILDIDWFEDSIVETSSVCIPKEYDGDAKIYKEKLIESLLTCSGLHYTSSKSKLGVLTLVSLCKTSNIGFEEFDAICYHISDPSSSLKDKNVRKTAWQGWNPYHGMTAKIRDKFIKDYGGKSKFIKQTATEKKEELLQIIREKWGNDRNQNRNKG